MKLTESKLRQIIRSVIREETEYQKFFKKELEKTGKSIPQMSDEEKKAFFNKIDAAWKGKGEKNESYVHPIEAFPQKYKDLLKKLQRSNDPSQMRALKQKMNIIRKEMGLKPLSIEFDVFIEAKELKWQDAEVGDAANVKAINKTGLIIKTYGRKFHLKFPNGSTKTYDANELTFVKNESVNEDTNLDEGFKEIALAGLIILGGVLGTNHLNHSVQRGLDAGEKVELRTRSTIFNKNPLTRTTFELKVDPNQREPIKVDTTNGVITINTSDVSNVSLKRDVRKKIQKIDPTMISKDIRTTRFDVIKKSNESVTVNEAKFDASAYKPAPEWKKKMQQRSEFGNLLSPNDVKFLVNSQTKTFTKGNNLIVTDGNRWVVFNTSSPVSKVKRLGNAPQSVKDLHSNS